MTTCIGCSCRSAADVGCGNRVLLSTRVDHNLGLLRAAIRQTDGAVTEVAPGLLEVLTADPVSVLAAARRNLSALEATEVRALVLGAEQGGELLAAALTAPTLKQISARAEHADLLPLFADELNAFRSVYQPIVSLERAASDPEVIGYEALLRAEGPAGPLMPDDMFAAAAAAGWLHTLDRVGRTTALRGAAGWLGTAKLFVNFLPTTIYRPEVCLRTTEEAALAAGLRLDQLVFEVTESEQITDIEHLAEVFTYYRERGCQIALDDLGAGYSSLNLLVRLQPDVVKLDKEIVQRLPGAVSTAVIAAVVDIVHSYGGLVLAECVETAHQAEAARVLGVDLAQGWFFGRPQERTAQTRRRIAGDVAPTKKPLRRGPSAVPDIRAPRVSQVQALLLQSLERCSGGVTMVDMKAANQPLIYVNPGFEQITGYAASELVGQNCRILQGSDIDPEAVRRIQDALNAGREHVSVIRNRRKDGSSWWNELRLSPLKNSTGEATHYFGFQNDVSERVEAEQRLANLAFHDKLTGLPNRGLLLHELDRAIARASSTDKQLTLLFIDLDGFKAINDRFGHVAGDLALAATAMKLRRSLRDGDLLGRYGGDEFIAVLTDVPDDHVRTAARRAADTVIDSFHSPVDLADQHLHIGVTIGVALFPEHGTDAEALVHAADKAMYAAKKAGRGRAAIAPRPRSIPRAEQTARRSGQPQGSSVIPTGSRHGTSP